MRPLLSRRQLAPGHEPPPVTTASSASRHHARRNPEGVRPTVIGGRWPRRRKLLRNRREQPEIRDHRSYVFFVPVRRMVPDHALPVKRAAVWSDAAADRSRDLMIGPRPNPRLSVTGDIARPERSESPPADFLTSRAIRVMTEGA